jgi:hypothetical protein
VYHDWSWQPIWRHIGILQEALRNLGKPFGLLYLTAKPRLDIWWLDSRWWLAQRPMRLVAVISMLLFIGAVAVGGVIILRRALRSPVATPVATRSALAPE